MDLQSQLQAVLDSDSESDVPGWESYSMPEVKLLTELSARCYIESQIHKREKLVQQIRGLPGVLIECMLPFLSARILQAVEDVCQAKEVQTAEVWERHLEKQHIHSRNIDNHMNSGTRWQQKDQPSAYTKYWTNHVTAVLTCVLSKSRNELEPDCLQSVDICLHRLPVHDMRFGQIAIILSDSQMLSYRMELERTAQFLDVLGWLSQMEMESALVDLHVLSLLQSHVRHLCLWLNTSDNFTRTVVTAQLLIHTLMVYGKLDKVSLNMIGGSTGTGVMQIIGAGPGAMFRQLLQVCAGITTHRVEDIVFLATQLGYSHPELIPDNPYVDRIPGPKTIEESMKAYSSNKRLFSSVVRSNSIRAPCNRTEAWPSPDMVSSKRKREPINDDSDSEEEALNKRLKLCNSKEGQQPSSSPSDSGDSSSSGADSVQKPFYGLNSFSMNSGNTLLLTFNVTSGYAPGSSIVNNYLPEILKHWENLEHLTLNNTRLHISNSQPILDSLCDKIRNGKLISLKLDDNTALDYNVPFLEKVMLSAKERGRPLKCLSIARLRLFLTGDWNLHSSDLVTSYSGTEQLILSGCKLQSEATEFLQVAIANDQALQHLDLYGCRIALDDLKPVLQAITGSGRMRSLSLGKIQEVGNVEIKLFAEMVMACRDLQFLDLSGCWLPVDFMNSEFFMSAVIDHPTLSTLNLCNNHIDAVCFDTLMKRLQKLPYNSNNEPKFCTIDLTGRSVPHISAHDIINTGEKLKNKSALRCLCQKIRVSFDDDAMDEDDFERCKQDIEHVYSKLVYKIEFFPS